jgi:hypothetical protein
VKNTADVTGGKLIAVLLQSISGVSALSRRRNPLVAFYDIHGGKREALFFYFVPDTTRDYESYFSITITNILKYRTVWSVVVVAAFSLDASLPKKTSIIGRLFLF